jgi:hypothetical protein
LRREEGVDDAFRLFGLHASGKQKTVSAGEKLRSSHHAQEPVLQ